MTDTLLYWVWLWFITPGPPQGLSVLEIASLVLRLVGVVVACKSVYDCWIWDFRGALRSGENGVRLLISTDRFIGAVMVVITQVLLCLSLAAVGSVRERTAVFVPGILLANFISAGWLLKGYLVHVARQRLKTYVPPVESPAEPRS
jgi:hypothetical protein